MFAATSGPESCSAAAIEVRVRKGFGPASGIVKQKRRGVHPHCLLC
jgi:hypothetical protein